MRKQAKNSIEGLAVDSTLDESPRSLVEPTEVQVAVCFFNDSLDPRFHLASVLDNSEPTVPLLENPEDVFNWIEIGGVGGKKEMADVVVEDVVGVFGRPMDGGIVHNKTDLPCLDLREKVRERLNEDDKVRRLVAAVLDVVEHDAAGRDAHEE